MGILSWLKYWLSHIDDTTWHYQFTHSIWGNNTPGKACYYYWGKLPLTLIAWIVILVLGFILAVGGWFCGYVLTDFKTTDPFLLSNKGENDLFYPYRYTSKGKLRRIMPWQVAIVAVFGALVYYLSVLNPEVGIRIGVVALVVAVLVTVVGGLIFLISSNWNSPIVSSARSNVVAAWNRSCPEMVVETSKEPEEPTA